MTLSGAPILVTGATGAQGGATARALLRQGRRIRIISRDPDKPAAELLRASGAEVMAADFNDADSIAAAMQGVSGVFSLQLVAPPGTDDERKHGFTLVNAARKAGVRQFVHTSVRAAGAHTSFPGWRTGRWSEKYWTDKWDIEEAVRGAGFASWTVLKPVFIMENFIPPKVHYMFPHLRQGEIATAFHAATRLQLVAADDIGKFACAAFQDPWRLHGKNIDLAVEALTMAEVAGTIAAVTGRPVTAVELTPQQAVEAGLAPGWIRSQEWTNEVGYQADIEAVRRHGIPLETFRQWAGRHKTQFVIDQQ